MAFRILILGINYAPEKTGIGPFTAGIAEHLARSNKDVTVVTAFPYYPQWRVFEGYGGALYRRERTNGVSIRRVRHFIPSRPSSLWQRLLHDLSFSFNAFWVALLAGKFDMIYCYLPPPTLGLTAYLLGKIKGCPYAVDLEDMASDAALSTGILREGPALRLARRVEALVYDHAANIICLCQAFANHLIERGVSPGKIVVIPHWGETESIGSIQSSAIFRTQHGIGKDDFVVLHTGNMGKKQGLINVVNAAERLTRECVTWVLVGDGEDQPELQREIVARDIKSVRLLPLQPVEMLPHMYAEADVCLVNQKAAIRDEAAPAKLLSYMAARRPIIAAVDASSEAARQVRAGECGIVVPPDNAQALSDAVESLRCDPPLRRALGENGRAYAEAHFTKSSSLAKYEAFFDGVLDVCSGKARKVNPAFSRQ